MAYDFNDYKKDAATRPSSKAWSNWFVAGKVGDKVQGYIRDVFYRKAEGLYKDARGITLEQADGVLINVSIKRIDFVLGDTNNARLGDPLTVVFESEKANKQAGFSPTKIMGYYWRNIDETKSNKTVAELDAIDKTNGGQDATRAEENTKADTDMANIVKSASEAVETPKA